MDVLAVSSACLHACASPALPCGVAAASFHIFRAVSMLAFTVARIDSGTLLLTHASYFEMYPGIWRHGDWIEITDRGTAVIYGRSDSTINRHGVRMGTSEIYRAVLEVDEVVDALVVDVPRPGTEGWMPLFVVMAEDTTLDDEIKAEIKCRIREDCSPRHVPNEIYEVAEIPRTQSGKVLEIPVKKILMGTRPENAASRDSLANPEALDYFVELARSLPVG